MASGQPSEARARPGRAVAAGGRGGHVARHPPLTRRTDPANVRAMGDHRRAADLTRSGARRAAHAPSPDLRPDHARILELQRDAGNGAVAAAFTAVRAVRNQLTAAMFALEPLMPFDAWFAITSRLVYAGHDLEMLEKNLETARIERETAALLRDVERTKAEMARLREETARLRDHAAGHPGRRAAERIQTLGSIATGVTDEVELTDRVFLERHPEREARPLDPDDPADRTLVREWVAIRHTIVAPVLGSELAGLLLAAEPSRAERGPTGDAASPAA